MMSTNLKSRVSATDKIIPSPLLNTVLILWIRTINLLPTGQSVSSPRQPEDHQPTSGIIIRPRDCHLSVIKTVKQCN